MTNKKTDAKRLLLFLLLAFGIAWIPAIILNETVGYEEWFSGPFALTALPLIFAPALANIITRKLTGEGWENSLFHFNFKGHLKYYAAAVLIPLLNGIMNNITMTLIYGKWDFSEMTSRQSIPEFIGSILLITALAPLYAWNTFGEEFGWRAYMNQKMEPLIGTAGTVVAGGIIWGVWHAPLTVAGHNFGTDYPGYPWLGIVTMSLWCTTLGAFLMWVTKRSGSVFPAAILHACSNGGLPLLGAFFQSGFGDGAEFTPTLPQRIISMIPFMLCAAGITAVMMRKGKDGEAPAEK